MYTVDRDQPVALDLAPRPDSTGDPLPIVLAKDGAVILSYVAGRELTVMATFPICQSHRFGEPGAGALGSHPLAGRGLKPHGAFEVLRSSWAGSFPGGPWKHFVFTFRDSLFECVSNDIGVELIREDDDTIKLMARRLYK